MKPRHALLLVAALAVLAHVPVLGADFILVDDPANIYDNPLIKGPFATALWRFWSAPYYKLYIPLTYSAWLALGKLSIAFFGEVRPTFFHTFNLVLHAGASVLVFLVLRSLLAALTPAPAKGKTKPPAPGPVHDLWAPLLGAALFAVHPIQTEAIAWATGARDLMAAVFSLAAMLVFFQKGPVPGRRHDLRALLLFGLAILSKPSAIVLPAVLYALNALIYRWNRDAILKRLLPWFGVSAGLAVAQKTMQSDDLLDAVPGLLERPIIALDALGHYATRLLVPLDLALDYTRTPGRIFHDPRTVLHAAAAIALLVAVARFRALRAPFAVFALSVAPVLGFLAFDHQNFSTVTDRYAYFALLGPALLAALATVKWPRPARLAGAGALLACLALDLPLALAWRDSPALFGRLERLQPESYLAHFNQALTARKRQDYVAELDHLRKAHAARPRAIEPIYALGVALGDSGQLPEALRFFEDVLGRETPGPDPLSRANFAKIRYNYAVMLVRAQRLGEARREVQRALELDPGFAPAQEAMRKFGN